MLLTLEVIQNLIVKIIYNATNFKNAALFRFNLLLRELRWHMSEVRRFKVKQIVFVTSNKISEEKIEILELKTKLKKEQNKV